MLFKPFATLRNDTWWSQVAFTNNGKLIASTHLELMRWWEWRCTKARFKREHDADEVMRKNIKGSGSRTSNRRYKPWFDRDSLGHCTRPSSRRDWGRAER